MKRRSREINIFSMSALDLFASALGAFILLAVIALPFFPNLSEQDMQQQLAQAQAEMAQAQARLQACQAESEQAAARQRQTEQALQSCREALKKTFVLVLISWGKTDDVDLHVIDPRGNEYYYERKTHPGSTATLEEDNTRGPGNEIWLAREAAPGKHSICYKLYAKRSRSVEVRGRVLHQSGNVDLAGATLSREGEKRLIAELNVDRNGEVSVRPASGRCPR